MGLASQSTNSTHLIVEENVEATESDDSLARHRLDTSFTFYDGYNADILHLGLGYTYNLTSNLNTSFSTSIIDPNLSEGGDFGFGDSSWIISYVPYATISANPWIPKAVGSGLGIIIPTGDPKTGAGEGSWMLSPFLGASLPIKEYLYLLPNISYVYSLNETELGADVRVGSIQADIIYVYKSRFWISYVPEYWYDFSLDQSHFNHTMTIGAMVTQGIGISIDYGNIERAIPGSQMQIKEGSDYLGRLNFHIVF